MGKTPSNESTSYQQKSKPQEHFTRAQDSWNEVYGRAISGKRNWRNLCFILSLVLLFAISGVIYQGSQSKVIPYVVVLDKAGQELHTGIAVKTLTNDVKIIKKELEGFVKKGRLASVDRQLMRQNFDWIYAHMLPNTPALKKLNAYYEKNNPFTMVRQETRIVRQITSTLPVTKDTYAIEWEEAIRKVSDGEIKSLGKYKAIITIIQKDPETEKQLKLNPFGIWIVDYQWEKKL